MTKDQESELAEIEKREKAATPGPWLFAGWTISDSDRILQKENKPYWSMTENSVDGLGLSMGPLDRKSIKPDYVLAGIGLECDGIDGKQEDLDFIAHSRQDIPFLLSLISSLKGELAEANRASQNQKEFEKACGFTCSHPFLPVGFEDGIWHCCECWAEETEAERDALAKRLEAALKELGGAKCSCFKSDIDPNNYSTCGRCRAKAILKSTAYDAIKAGQEKK